MKPNPRAIAAEALALEALQRMEDFRITSLFVTDDDGLLIGILHIHDLWGLEPRRDGPAP
jgi:arabinose-5-phosphate isomerase